MKRLILAIALLLPGLSALAGEPYFCLQPGRTLYYERYDASGTKLKRTTTMDIVSVTPDGNGRRVEYGFTLRKARCTAAAPSWCIGSRPTGRSVRTWAPR